MTALAASVLVAVGAAWLHRGGYDQLRSDAYTAIGETRRVELADGSVVTLNTDTALSYHVDAQRRDVKLYRGEAYFQVMRDPTRPFVVDSPAGSVRVLGTAFNVRLDNDRAHVSVVEGRVSVSSAGEATVLTRSQSAWLHEGIETGAERDADVITAWQRGRMVFYRTPLSDVMKELSRYRRGTIYIRGDALRALPVSGSFEVTHPEEGLRVVLSTLPVRSIALGSWLTVIY